jgi:hypothetical protein
MQGSWKNALQYFSGRFDSIAGTTIMTFLDEIGIPPEHPLRAQMRSRVTGDNALIEGKSKDAKNLDTPETVYYMAENTKDLDASDRRCFYLQCLDIFRHVNDLPMDHPHNIAAKSYLDGLLIEMQQPGFHDHVLTFLARRDISKFDRHRVGEITQEHAILIRSAKPVERRWAWSLLHEKDNIRWQDYEKLKGIAALRAELRSAFGKREDFDIAAPLMGQHFQTWAHEDGGGLLDSVHNRQRFTKHGELVAALAEEMQGCEMYSKCFVAGNPGVRVLSGSFWSTSRKSNGSWYRFNFQHIVLPGQQTMDKYLCEGE